MAVYVNAQHRVPMARRAALPVPPDGTSGSILWTRRRGFAYAFLGSRDSECARERDRKLHIIEISERFWGGRPVVRSTVWSSLALLSSSKSPIERCDGSKSFNTFFFLEKSLGILLSSAKAPTARSGLSQRWYTGRLSKLDRPEIAVPENLTPGLSDVYAAVLYYSVRTVPRPSAAAPPS